MIDKCVISQDEESFSIEQDYDALYFNKQDNRIIISSTIDFDCLILNPDEMKKVLEYMQKWLDVGH